MFWLKPPPPCLQHLWETLHADHIRNRHVQNNDETFQEFEKIAINDSLQLPDSTVMPNQSNSPQTTEQQNQHKTLTVQILPKKKLVKRHWDNHQEFEIDLVAQI